MRRYLSFLEKRLCSFCNKNYPFIVYFLSNFPSSKTKGLCQKTSDKFFQSKVLGISRTYIHILNLVSLVQVRELLRLSSHEENNHSLRSKKSHRVSE